MRSSLLVLLLLAGCDRDESPWEPPCERTPPIIAPLTFDLTGWCDWSAEMGARPDPTPAAVVRWIRERIRWRAESREYWQYPAETIAHGFGDCEDHALLAAAALRGRCPWRLLLVFGVRNERWHVWLLISGVGVIDAPDAATGCRFTPGANSEWAGVASVVPDGE